MMGAMLRPLLVVGVLVVAAGLAPHVSADKGLVKVPGGTFHMGSTTGEPDERPVHTVRLKSFELQRTEVTQKAYGRCVQAGACRPARRYPSLSKPALPVVGVTWHDARAYCTWRGMRLPSEAEWERAARGTDGRRYPWGETLECKRANFGNFLGAGPCAAHNPGRVLPPGSRTGGASPTGAQDMAGNVWEWVEDTYGPYPRGGKGASGTRRVVRGGSCCSYFAMPTTTNRLSFPPGYRDRDLGFRCAR
jgi:formylglycine-generating enzyme required for sulfatase activity